jgi:hypothetical protein
MTDEVKRLCNEIKRLVPPNKAQSTTGPFDVFIKELGPKITPQELDSIHRAYNYFNRLVTLDLNTPVAESKEVNTGNAGAKKDDQSGSGAGAGSGAVDASLPPKPNQSLGQLKNPGTGVGASGPIDETTTEEMITILVGLMNPS